MNLKPKKTVEEIVDKMKKDKGITFNYMSRLKAIEFLSSTNNYLRTASYRKNIRNTLMVLIKGSILA